MAKPEPRSQAMPMDRSILWNPSLPGAKPTGRAPYPIFFQQEAVIAMQEHLKSSPTQAIFGFLIGSVYRDPETGVLYTVIDKTLKLNQAIYGDKTEVVVSRLWDRMQEQLAKASGTLLGWYHSHPGQGGYLTAHDVETHEKFFTDPWQVAILVAAEAGGVTGRFFRVGQDGDWHKTPLPFYELLQPESIKPDGKKRSFITWRNYKPYGPTLTGPKPKPAPPSEAAAPPPPPPPPPPPRPRTPPPPPAEEEDIEEEVEEAEEPLRIMRGSADDIPVIRTSADDEPATAPPRKPTPPPPPPRQSVKRPAAPVFFPDEPPVPPAPPPPPPLPPPPTQPRSPRGSAPDIPWQVAPEELPPPPFVPPPPPPPAAPPREPRRTPTHKFRLLEEETRQKPAPAAKPRRRKRRGGWLGRFALLLVLAGIGGGAYWYFKMRDPGTPPPWAGLVDRVQRLVSRGSPPPPPPPRTASRPAPRPAAPPNPFARFDRLSNDLSRAVRNFQDRAALFAAGRINCTELANGLVTIENLWITYNTERRARISAFDPRRAANDQALYARVDSVESRFEASGCRRP